MINITRPVLIYCSIFLLSSCNHRPAPSSTSSNESTSNPNPNRRDQPVKLDGSFVISSYFIEVNVANEYSNKWLVISHPLTIGQDGIFNDKRLSFIKGDFIGRSLHHTGVREIVPPLKSFRIVADLRKSYANLDMKSSVPPSATANLEYALFDHLEAAQEFAAKSYPKSKFQRKLSVPWILK